MIRSILRNFSVFAAATVVDRVVTFLFLVYAARALGPDVFGQFLLIGTYVLFFTMLFTAGVTPVAMREIVRARDNPGPVLEQVLSLRLVLGACAYALLLLITGLVLPAGTFLPMAAIAGTSLVLDAFKDSYTAYHSASERMTIPSVFQVANTVLTSASGAVLLYLGFGILPLLAASALVNLLLIVVWHFLFSTRFQRYRVRVAVSAWKHMLLMAASIAPLMLVFQVNRLANVMMLSLIGGPVPPERAVGYYGPAQQIANVPLGFMHGLRYAMVPPVANKMNRGERIDAEFAIALKVAIVFLSFPMLVATSLFPGEILNLAFGKEYLPSTVPLQFLGAAAALAIAASFPETFVISNPEKDFLRFLPGALVTLVVNVGLCLALIPTHGAAGAAFAFMLARVAHLFFFLYYSRAVLPLDSLGLKPLWGPLAILSATYAACLLVRAAIESPVLGLLAVTGLSAAGMLAAGQRELILLASKAVRRGRGAI